MRNRIIALIVGVLVGIGLTIGLTSAANASTPAAAGSVVTPDNSGVYHLFGYAYTNSNYGGTRSALYTNGWVGPCDGSGYTMSWTFDSVNLSGTSSLKDASIGDRCNYVWLYTSSGAICGNGAFSNFGNLTAACNDKVRKIRFFEDNRLPW